MGALPRGPKRSERVCMEVSVRPKGDGAFGIEKIWWMSGDTRECFCRGEWKLVSRSIRLSLQKGSGGESAGISDRGAMTPWAMREPRDGEFTSF